MSTRQQMIDATARHHVYLQRYAGGLTKQLLSFINKLRRKSAQLLGNADALLTKFDYQMIVNELNSYAQDASTIAVNSVIKDLQKLAQHEVELLNKLVLKSTKPDTIQTTIPDKAVIKKQVFESSMKSSVPDIGLDKNKDVEGTLNLSNALVIGGTLKLIKDGFSKSKTRLEIRDNIGEYIGRKITTSQAHTVARTVTNYVSNKSRSAFYKENEGFINAYQIVAVLDSQTTVTCQALDGKVFPIAEFESPPYHYNCRTTFVGVIDPKFSLASKNDTRPSSGSDGKEEVNTGTTYNSWLKNQSSEFQDDVLGYTRAQMFREGANVGSFVDQYYTPYTLQQLKDKDGKLP